MTRGDFFLLCVQTLVIQHVKDSEPTTRILQAAADVPEEAYGGEKSLSVAALDFFRHHYSTAFTRPKKPEWLAAWEEGQKNRVSVRVDQAMFGCEWWGRSVRDETFPRGMEALVDGRARWRSGGLAMVVSRAQAELFKAWGASFPGWDQEPFSFSDVVD